MHVRRPSPVLVLLAWALAACSSSTAQKAGKKGEACSATAPCEAALVCTEAPAGLPATPGHPACAAPARHYTFRAVAGVSMGAAGTSRIAATYPEAFDAAGMLGGPLDAALLLRNIEGTHLGGFCPADMLEAALALDKSDGGNRLDRPDGVPGCTQADTPRATQWSHSQRFNKWAFTTNGGHFDRNEYLDIFTDLTLALGNPLGHNPNSPSLAAPLTPAQFAAATCSQPAVVPRVWDRRYSPHGEHSAITFCDGDAPVWLCADGTGVDWCAAAALAGRQLARVEDAVPFCQAHGGGAREANEFSSNAAEVDLWFARQGTVPGCWPGTKKVPVALAIDLNGNGRRDWHEPILLQAREPFDDVGADGCPDAREDGKGGCTTEALSPYASGKKDPNGDDWDPLLNPEGTEGDHLWEPGEPFEDVGLDGVAGTGDLGEGDGKYTVSPGFQKWLDHDLRTRLGAWGEAQKRSLDVFADGGIRDVFDLGAMAAVVGGAARSRLPGGAAVFSDFFEIPSADGRPWLGRKDFDPLKLDPTVLTRNMLLLYGDPAASVADQRAGDGDHVGTVPQLLSRFVVFGRWLTQRWDAALPPIAARGPGTSLTGLRYRSAVLGADWNYAVSLPPAYDDPANATRRYPVLLMLHGYGQSADDMSGTAIFFNVLNNVGMLREMIVVYPSGQCCLTGPNGERSCAHKDAAGHDLESQGWVEECRRGNFYVDRQGLDGTDQTRYGEAILELLHEVDGKFRTLPPADGPAF